MPEPKRTIYQSITADGPQTYTDGYGTTREMYESPIITELRKFHHWINMDQTLSDKAYLNKYGYNKPNTGIGALGLLSGGPNIEKVFMQYNKAGFYKDRIYNTLLSKLEQIPEQRITPSLKKAIRNFYANSRRTIRKTDSYALKNYLHNEAEWSGKRALEEADKIIDAINKENEAARKAEAVKQALLKEQKAKNWIPHTEKTQSILDSDFQPFDEMQTLFQTGSKAKTTADFKLSDYRKQGGVLFAKSGIHIKKANRGKFTDYCGGKVTSECIARGKASSNPTIRKRATFAANARKWKHQNGGKIMPFWVHNMLGE